MWIAKKTHMIKEIGCEADDGGFYARKVYTVKYEFPIHVTPGDSIEHEWAGGDTIIAHIFPVDGRPHSVIGEVEWNE